MYDRIQAKVRSGNESLHSDGQPTGVTLLEFWRWSASDLVSNAQRGVLAEFLVGVALGASGEVRTEWDAYDLQLADGTKVEVKSSGYLQSWKQTSLSRIRFGIAAKKAWDAASNTSSSERLRSAEVYVFAVHAHTCQETIDPLNVKQWQFYVLPTSVLNEACEGQSTLSLSALKSLKPIEATFPELKDAVVQAAEENRRLHSASYT